MHSVAAVPQRPEDFESWLWDGVWKVYKFHYRYFTPYEGPELIEMRNSFLRFASVELFICYLVMDHNNDGNISEFIDVDEDVFILNLSTFNSGHSLDEAMSFVSYYIDSKSDFRIGINNLICEKLPHVYQCILRLIPPEKILLLNNSNIYRFNRCIFRRNTHYNYVRNWKDISFSEENSNLRFELSSTAPLDYPDSPWRLQSLSRKIWEANRRDFEPRVVMLCKTTDELLAATPKRAMHLAPKHRAELLSAGVHILSPSQVTSFDEYVSLLHGCKTFITSYGAAACTNRFFVQSETNVIVLANQHYRSEYAETTTPPYRHLRQTHLFPVGEQEFILDHNDVFNDRDIEALLEKACK